MFTTKSLASTAALAALVMLAAACGGGGEAGGGEPTAGGATPSLIGDGTLKVGYVRLPQAKLEHAAEGRAEGHGHQRRRDELQLRS